MIVRFNNTMLLCIVMIIIYEMYEWIHFQIFCKIEQIIELLA